MTQDDYIRRLEMLRVDHRDLDVAIAALAETALPDMLAIARLKKRKLLLRDEMSWIEDRLIPDIIA
ncbi:MAG: YdcH family protein [Sphingopyxis sp.]